MTKPANKPNAPEEFSLNIKTPTALNVHLGRGITTDPISLKIKTDPASLTIGGGVKVPVKGADKPLDFRMTMGFKGTKDGPGFTLDTEMIGLWTNPFDLGSHISIGNMHLGLDINWARFAETGLPDAFSYSG